MFNLISCVKQQVEEEEYQWNPDTIIVVDTLCQHCTRYPYWQRRSLEQLEHRRQRIYQEIAFEQERKVEVNEFRHLLQDKQVTYTNVITYINPMINPPNPYHPTRANALCLIYAYTVLVTDYSDRTGLISMRLHGLDRKPAFFGSIIEEKLLKESMKAKIDSNAIYFQQERMASKLVILTPVTINSLAPDEVDCTICHMPLGQGDSLGAIELAYQTSCNHIFGGQCITTWLKGNNTCPICRSQLAIPRELAITEEEEEEEFWDEVFMGCAR